MTKGVVILDAYEDLVVSLRMLIQEYFPDVQIHSTDDPADALRILDEHDILLVLADDRTARATSSAFFDDAIAKAPNACHAMLTTDPRDDVNAMRAAACGADIVVSKPMDPEWFVRFVARSLGEARAVPRSRAPSRRRAPGSCQNDGDGHRYSWTRSSNSGK
jgi:DNA-binding NarL/FixJ family response regulator